MPADMMNEYQQIHHDVVPHVRPDYNDHDACKRYWDQKTVAGNARHKLTNVYGWAIPNEKAIQAIAAFDPIVEIGAGTGYWADLLTQAGADVQAFDLRTIGRHTSQRRYAGLQRAHHPVSRGGWQRALRLYPTRTVLMVWPCYGKSWSGEVVKATQAEFVVHVGEDYGGCTGSQEMHWLLSGQDYWWDDENPEPEPEYRKLKPLFEPYLTVDIPQWPGLHDYVQVYKRLAL